ncbi:hypothetical protein M0657_000433 [Pyricularia oryzae]|nr:hypothetical protein M9X92_004088 [Pyricularia oryzae]KAI7932684.1 hypothetical protein M0657_000433 [Pyricularia oryzae]
MLAMHIAYRSYTHTVDTSGAFNHTHTPSHFTDARRGPVIPCLWGPYRYVLCLIPVILQHAPWVHFYQKTQLKILPWRLWAPSRGFLDDGRDGLHEMTEIPLWLLQLLECVASSDLQGTSFGS